MAAVMAGYLSAPRKGQDVYVASLELTLADAWGTAAGADRRRRVAVVGKALQPIGTAFIQAIQMIVIPLIFAAVSLGVYRMGESSRQLGRVAVVAFCWFYVATLFAVLVALGLNGLFHPGRGANLVATGSVSPNLALSVDWTKYLLDFIPTNIVAAMAAQRVLPTLVFAVLFGLGLARIGQVTARPMVVLMEAVLATMFRVTGWIIALSPLAIFAIMAWLFATQGMASIIALTRLIGLMYLGLLIMVLCCWLVLALIRENPFAITRGVLEPVLLAFTTRSSEVTLPVHMEALEQMGVPNKVVSLVLPLGYSFNLDGSTLYVTFGGHLPCRGLPRTTDLGGGADNSCHRDDCQQRNCERSLGWSRCIGHSADRDRSAGRGDRHHSRS